MTPIPVHPEGPRYVRSLVFVPGLWTPAAAFRPLASFLAHRGWAGVIADAGASGGVARRAADVAAFAATLGAPPVVVGHDAGGLIALEAARRAPLAGVVWLAPIGPRPRRLSRLLGTWRVAAAVLTGGALAAPSGPAALALFADPAPRGLLPVEAAELVRDVLRARAPAAPAALPLAILATASDPVAAEAVLPGAERLDVAAPGRWLLGAAAWRVTAGVLHRWLVQRLGAENLERYEEAMAERESESEEE